MPKNALILVRSDGKREEIDEYPGVVVAFGGEGALVEIGEWSRFRNSKITMGDGGHVSIGKTRRMINTVMDLSGSGQGKKLTIGAGTTIEGARFAMGGGGPRVVTIGNDCMLSTGITFRPSDGHAIFDLDSGKVINHSKPIMCGLVLVSHS